MDYSADSPTFHSLSTTPSQLSQRKSRISLFKPLDERKLYIIQLACLYLHFLPRLMQIMHSELCSPLQFRLTPTRRPTDLL